MKIFQTHARIVDDYADYITGFLNIADSKAVETSVTLSMSQLLDV